MNLRQLVERSDRPFAAQPQVARYFPAASMEDARRRLARSIERGDGPGVAIGGAGIGKSLLLQVLAAQYREKFDVVLLACAQLCTRRALLQAIHFELGLDYRRRDEGELRLSLLDTLLSGDEHTEGLLLLVDEAQALPTHLLEELRLLTNLSRGGVPRVRLVMAGLPSLEEKLASSELQAFSQRLTSRCYLTPLTRAETSQYIRAQLAAAQVDADRLFASAALDAVFTATDGIPRLVNQVCDRALVMADARRLEKIDASTIQAAWADLQQLPGGWETSPSAETTATQASVIEFGALSEQPDAPLKSAAPTVVESPTVKTKSTFEFPTATTPRPVAQSPILPSPPPVPQKPRVYNQPAPEAVDPFAESFDEEELVLDSFATLASIFGTRTPRVENTREPAISRMVQHALDASSMTQHGTAAAREPAHQDEVDSERDSRRGMIRLAVVSDASTVAEEPVSPAVEELYSPAESVDLPAAEEAADDTILVIEDDPAPPSGPQPGVRREGYRQLFSRLRHGT